MKIDARSGERHLVVDIRRREKAPLETFDLSLVEDEVEVTRRVSVLSRSGSLITLLIGDRIENAVAYRSQGKSWIEWRGHSFEVDLCHPRERILKSASASPEGGARVLKAQMPGKVVRILKRTGDAVVQGDGLVIIEAMKMQNELKAASSGVVTFCVLEEGATVNAGDLLYRIGSDGDA